MYSIYSKLTQKHIPVILGLLLFLLCYNNQSFAQSKQILSKPAGFNSWIPSQLLPKASYGMDNPGPDSVTRTDFTITMRDGVVIDCLKYVPVRAVVPAGGYYTVMMVHGYGDNKNTLATFCHDQATYGYYTMTFSVRGQGLSGGLSNLISNVERDDLLEIINWVKRDSINGSNPGKILIMGGSQGGILPFKAACNGANVAAIISSVAPPNFASSWIENGCVKMTCLWTMDYTSDTARYTQQVINMRNWILGDTKAGWDSLSRNLPIGRDFITDLPNCSVPMMIEATWQDKFFNSTGWLNNIQSVTVPMSSYIGAVQGHGGDHSATEDQWHMNWFNNWFFQWLWGMNTGILDAPKYQFASTTYPVNGQYWSFVHDSSRTLLNNISTPMKLYLNKSGRLKTTPNSPNILNLDNQTYNNEVYSNYSLQNAIDDEFKGTNFDSKFKVHTLTFDSDPLTAKTQMTGALKMNLDYTSTCKPFCQFNVQLYEVLPNGSARFISRINYMDRVNNYLLLPSRKQVVVNGQGHSHIFQPGSKIRIIITNLDRVAEDSLFFGSNPFVLPSMDNGTNTVYLSSSSYITLPIVSSATHSSALFNQESSNTEPEHFKLNQNYPNPFNPSTMIEYTITKQDKVELKVYDILGREVAVLVNEIQNPGSFSVVFNASNLPSGIYFSKLVSGSFSEVKKMILVK